MRDFQQNYDLSFPTAAATDDVVWDKARVIEHPLGSSSGQT